MNILLLVTFLVKSATPDICAAFENNRIRNSIISSLGERELKVDDVDATQVRYLGFGAQTSGSNEVPLRLLAPFHNLQRIVMSGNEIRGIVVPDSEDISCLGSLRELLVYKGTFGPLPMLSALPKLENLVIRFAGLGDGEMEHLAKCQAVKSLDLRNNKITSLAPFTGMAGLKRIDVRDNPVEASSLSDFAAKRSDVEVFSGRGSGEEPRPAEIARMRADSARQCSQRMIEHWQTWKFEDGSQPWKDKLPEIGENGRFLSHLEQCGETDYRAEWAAVIVRYAKFFKDQGRADYCFSGDDPFFRWFIEHFNFPKNETGLYPQESTVEWIKEHRDTLAASVLLDDMLTLYYSGAL